MHETDYCFYNIESPAVGDPASAGPLQMRGWLVAKNNHHFIDLRARMGSIIFPSVHGFPRVDLAAHFKHSRNWLPAEFTIDLDLSPGIAVVQIEALDLTGYWQSVHKAVFEVQASASSSALKASPVDPINAIEFGLLAKYWLSQLPFNDSITAITDAASALPYPKAVRQAHPPFHGHIVEPAAIAPAPYGQMEIVGWVFHESQTITRVLVTTDLLIFHPMEIGGDFAGVKVRYPDQPHADNCRFRGIVSVSQQLPTPTCVRIYAELADGSLHLCLASHCLPLSTEILKTPAAPISFWKFYRGWQTLKHQLNAQGVVIEKSRALTHEFWKIRSQASRAKVTSIARKHRFITSATHRASNKLRLLLITHNLNLEGAPLLFLEYAQYLIKEKQANIQVLSGQDGPLREAFVHLGAPVTIVDTRELFRAPSSAAFKAQLGQIASQINWADIDLVVANTLASFWGVLLAYSRERRSLFYIHESTSPQAFKALPALLLPDIIEAFKKATAVSFNTPATRVYYDKFGSGHNFHLNSAWIDLVAINVFRSENSRDQLRSTLNLGKNEKLIVNLGSVCARKGQHDFLSAIEWLWRCHPALAAQCRFVMVGGRDTRYQKLLTMDIAFTGRANIHIIPETNRAFDYLGAADLFVCTSYEESFPRVVLEAMAFSTPIVSTHVHGIPHMLSANQEALLVPPADTARIAEAMIRLLQNSGEARTLAEHALARVNEFDSARLLPHHAAFTERIALQGC